MLWTKTILEAQLFAKPCPASSSCTKRRSSGMLGSSMEEVIAAEQRRNWPRDPSPNAQGRNWKVVELEPADPPA